MNRIRSLLRQTKEERKVLARELDEQLDPIMTALGVVFLLLFLAEGNVPEASVIAKVYDWAVIVIWATFVLEFVLRLVIEPNTKDFLKNNWWQIPLLVIPVLRFLRLFRLLRVARAGRALRSAVKGSRSANQHLGSRLGWVLAIHVIVVLAATNLLHDLVPGSYGEALHAAAMNATVGEPIPGSRGYVDLFEVVLAIYSVVFFAAITGSLADFYFKKRDEAQKRADA